MTCRSGQCDGPSSGTCRSASLYEAFPAVEVSRIAKRLEFPHALKHGSQLNMAQMESVRARDRLRGSNPDAQNLERVVNANVSERNATAAAINWGFTRQGRQTQTSPPLPVPFLI